MKKTIKERPHNGPFRQKNGEIVARKVGDPYEFDLYDRAGLNTAKYDRGIFMFQKYEVELKDGTAIKVDKAVGFKHHGGAWVTDLPDRYMFNCHGNVFLDRQFWLNDPDFDKLLKGQNPYYEEVSKEDAEFVVLWFGGEMMLSAWVYTDDNGNYVYEDKAEHGDITAYGEEGFHRERVKKGFIPKYYRSSNLIRENTP